MTRILEQLYDSANDRFRLWRNQEYASQQASYSQAIHNYIEKLTDEQRSELDNLISRRNYLNSIEQGYFFVEGFRMGAMLMSEIYDINEGCEN